MLGAVVRRALSVVVATATLSTLTAVAVAPPAVAVPDDPAVDVIEGLNSTLAFFEQLGDVGDLAQPLAGLGIAPGGPDGIDLSTLLTRARDELMGGATYGAATSLDAVVETLDGADGTLADGRTVETTASRSTATGDVSRITVTVAAGQAVDTGLDVADSSPAFTFSASAGVRARFELVASFVLLHDASERTVALERTGSTPSLGMEVSTSIPDPSEVSAGLGILAVRLGAGSSFALDATLAASFADPDDDGRLAFEEADGAPGELAASGAGAGLANVALTAGSLQSTLHITAVPSPQIDLPSASATVTVASADLVSTPPQVSFSAGALDAVNAFLTLSPRDLAQGLAEIATTLVSLQRAGGVDLPFLRGDLADAVKPAEAIAEFLQERVADSADPAVPGKPDFASLQELLELLADETGLPSGADFTVGGASYDATKKKVRFDLTISRAAGTAQKMNALGAATSGSGGTVSYTPTTLKDTSQDFSDEQGEALSYVGRQVLAGAGSAIVLSASGNTLTLDTTATKDPLNAWAGGVPNATTPYSISAGDPRTGLVELGNLLKSRGGIANANAKTSVAVVTPSYTATLPIVLDLTPPSTTDCDPGPGTAACPFRYEDPATGIATVITALPLAPDRIKLRTGRPLVTADAPIFSSVDVDATVGFVGVEVEGSLRLCTQGSDATCATNSTASGHLFELGLASGFGDADGDATLPEIGRRLTAALTAGAPLTSVIDADVNGQAYADLKVKVPGASGFFPGGLASATVTMSDITNPAGAVVTAPQLGSLVPLDVDPENPLALLGVLLADLQALQSTLGQLPGASDVLKTKIPLVGRSLSDLIGSGVSGGGETVTFTPTTLTDTSKTFDPSSIGRRVTVGTTTAVALSGSGSTLTVTPWNVQPAPGSPYAVDSELQGVVNLLTASPPANLQQALDVLERGLGTGSGVDFTVDTSGGEPVLELDLAWTRSVEKTLPLSLSFDLGGTDRALVGATGSGSLDVSVGGAIDLGLEIPLSAASVASPLTALKIDPQSTVSATASLTGTGLRLGTNVGPLQLSLGNPDTTQPAGTALEAEFGVALAHPAPGAPVTLAQFASALEVDVDNGSVECPGLVPGGQLAACAVLPVYLNGALIGDAADSSFVLRLPSGADDLTEAFDLTGPPMGGQPRFAAPADLGEKLAEAGLSLFTLGDGLFAYVEFLENALRTASADGTLPLIGEDLQAGSQFLTELRTKLESAFAEAGIPTGTSVGDIQAFLDAQVAPALGVAAPLPVTFQCEVFLAQANVPGVVAEHDGVTTTGYEYAVVARANSPLEDGIPSDWSTPVQNAATLDGAHVNRITWAASDHAQGYRVLRRVGGVVHSIADLPAGTLTFEDAGAAGTAYTPEDEDPKLEECPTDVEAGSVTGFTVEVDIGRGDPSAAKGCENDCETGTVPLDLGIPGLSFKATDAEKDKIQAKLGWKLDLEFGLDRDRGFFVKTQSGDGPTSSPELVLGASLDLPQAMQAQLAFFTIDVTKHAGTTAPLLRGAFAIDLRHEAGADDCHAACAVEDDKVLTLDTLRASSLGDLVDPRLTAAVLVDWDLKATVDSALPGIGARFVLQWDWTSQAPSDVSNLSQLRFEDVTIDPGLFIEKNLGPIVRQIIDVFKPVQPIIDTILAPLPVLSDLSKLAGGDDVTIASLAQTFSTVAGGPDLEPFFEVLETIRTIGKALTGSCPGGGSFCVNLGSFDIKKDLAMTTANSAATAGSLVSLPPALAAGSPLQQLDEHTPADLAGGATVALPDAACASKERGISFPALENPASMFGLLLNQDVELACFDSGPLSLGFEMNLRLGPVYAPPPVYVVISGGASVELRLAAGFDTYGIRTAVESGKAAKVLDSLYFKTTDVTGTPLPVVQFRGFLAAGASVSAVVIEVGIKGGIELTVAFTWNDPNNDGKFRFAEFLTTGLSNPICLFNVGGQLDLFIQVFVTLGISPFSVSFDFELVRVKLLDFSLKPNCDPPPPLLAGVEDGGSTLYLFAGSFGTEQQRGHVAWDNGGTADESWIVRQVADDPTTADQDERAIVVQALGITETFADAGGTAITEVVLDGRGYGGTLSVVLTGGSKDQPFEKDTIVFTGNGDDVVRAGSGDSWVDGGAGKDNLSTTDRPTLSVPVADAGRAVVAGGPGPDSIQVGNGADEVHGDNALSVTSGTLKARASDGTLKDLPSAVRTASSPGSKDVVAGDGDSVNAGLGGSEVWGGGGGDVIGTANDSPLADVAANAATQSLYRARKNTIVGGPGGDRIKSGSASDDVWTGTKTDPGIDGNGTGDLATDVNTVDTGTGSDTVHGSNGRDDVATGSRPAQSATVYGGAANDVLAGGQGTDRLYGGPGNDYVIAEPATVDTVDVTTDELGTGAYRVNRLPLPSSPSAKTLFGGGGSDRIYGGDGPALMYGDRDDFRCGDPVRSPLSDVSKETPTTSGSPDVDDAADLVVGGEGVDTVNAGGGDDHVHGKGAADRLCGSAGADRLSAGAGDDDVWGGSGDDTAYGDAGVDDVFGNDGTDTLYGGLDADVLEGDSGTDTAFGGLHDDLVVGGTRTAARADDGDVLYGDGGADVLIGDNGLPGQLFDLTSADAALGGDDVLRGGDGEDAGYGGLATDLLLGGDDADHLEGNPAGDSLFGEDGPDDLIGGSSQTPGPSGFPDGGDLLEGGAGDDVAAGDNAVLTPVTSGGTPITAGRGVTPERTVLLLDLGPAPAPGTSGQDTLRGQDDEDVLLGQGDVDAISGGTADDYAEGGPAGDTIDGDGGQDDLVGGSHVVHAGTGAARVGQPDGRDTVDGGSGSDVAIGDDGQVLRGTATTSAITQGRGMTERLVERYDLGASPSAVTSGGDWLRGAADADVLLGQGGLDRISGAAGDDHAEGGPAGDWLEGGDGDDDQVGGSSLPDGGDTGVTTAGQPDAADVVFGGAGDDLQLGDNAVVGRTGPTDPLTVRLAGPGDRIDERALRLLDLAQPSGAELASPSPSRFGADHLSGGAGVDVQLGQDGDEELFGGSEDDYQEGNGGGDRLHGDRTLLDVLTAPELAALDSGYLGARGDAAALEGAQGAAGQDDQVGGSSRTVHRDAGDVLFGDGAADFQLGDNGQLVRTIQSGDVYAFYTEYVATTVRRQSDRYDVDFGTASPRPYGDDQVNGGDGDDVQWGQDGDDLMHGDEANDDMHGELGADTMFGDAGEDAMVGDRGLITNTRVVGSSRQVTADTKGPAFFVYSGLRDGQLDRRVDLGKDGDGDVNGKGVDEKTGLTHGGGDTMRGGPDHDSMHGAFGDDLMNGDSGGDWMFGAAGVDVMWGGQGKPTSPLAPDANQRTDPGSPYFDSYVDYLFGGASGSDDTGNRYGAPSGADVLDWRPTGTYAACQAVTKVTDTCSPGDWWRATDTDDADVANNQHNAGIDWAYGGEGRDVLQGNVGKNGPDAGDRLMDWTGAFNLFTRCNASYGDDGDIRQLAPALNELLHTVAYGSGAGSTPASLRTAGTSGERELAFVSAGEQGNSGKAFTGTPGNFTAPACQP